jgi:hypothetical protein
MQLGNFLPDSWRDELFRAPRGVRERSIQGQSCLDSAVSVILSGVGWVLRSFIISVYLPFVCYDASAEAGFSPDCLIDSIQEQSCLLFNLGLIPNDVILSCLKSLLRRRLEYQVELLRDLAPSNRVK